MPHLVERWCELSPRIRLTVWLLTSLLLIALGSVCRHPNLNEVVSLPLNAQWRKMMPLRAAVLTESASPAQAFSALDFDTAGRHLVSWQPTGAGGELILEADWQSIPPIFTALAERRRIVRGFSILPERQRLRITLQLEAVSND